MPAQAPTYDLVLLLDPEADEQARARPLADAQAAIEAHGELLRHDEWGSRALSYAIHRRAAAQYHLLQFHVGNPELLRTLDRSLRIADEVLRFRIIKLRPGVPEAPDMRATATAPARRSPASQAEQPAGRADQPAGQAEQPAGQGEAPAGQAESPAGQAESPAEASAAGEPGES
jgi:small subunit ribosomal protein S6